VTTPGRSWTGDEVPADVVVSHLDYRRWLRDVTVAEAAEPACAGTWLDLVAEGARRGYNVLRARQVQP
jgi:hypothetical protein